MGGKISPYLTVDSMTLQEGKRAIAQAVSDHQVKVRGPRHPHVILPVQQPFWFNPPRSPLQKTHLEMAVLTTHHHTNQPSRGWECNRHQRDQRP